MNENTMIDSTLSIEKTNHVVSMAKSMKDGLIVGVNYTTARARFQLTEENILIIREHDILEDQYIEYPDTRTPEQKRNDWNLEHDYTDYPY